LELRIPERIRFLDARGREVPEAEATRLERYVYADDGELVQVEYLTPASPDASR